jgi:ElaB/YqjD/DUF883 family membrane-anchored ribosome-binding protein
VAQQSKATTTQTQNKEKNGSKSAQDIETEIQETRGAISDDIKALSDKFSPTQLKEEAKNAAKDAASGMKQAATDKASDMKDAVVGKVAEARDAVADTSGELKQKAVEVKDQAAEKLAEAKDTAVETIDEAAEQAKRFGSAAMRFTSENAVPLAMMGIGAGMMIKNSRQSSGMRRSYDVRTSSMRPYETLPSGRVEPLPRSQSEPRTRNMKRKLQDSVSHGEDVIRRRTEQSSDYVKERFVRARDATRTFAEENPLALAVATIAAGVGIGLLLPSTQGETRMLGPTREKLDRWVGGAKEAASDVTQKARETVSEALHS